MFKHIVRNIRLLSNYRKEPYLQFYDILGFYPDDISLYQLALRHKSVVRKSKTKLSNELLEFLGDAVFNSIITDIIFKRYEHKREGFLTNTRSKLVKREFLNQLALELGLDELVEKSSYIYVCQNSNIYGNAFEALIGAIYLDQGYRKCKNFVEQRLFETFIDLDQVVDDENNYKSIIIEYCQKHQLEYDYVLLKEELLDNNVHIFHTELRINGQFVAKGIGSSKKESQQNASSKAYQLIRDASTFLFNK